MPSDPAVEDVICEMRERVRVVDKLAGYQQPGQLDSDEVEEWADRLEVSGCGGGEPSEKGREEAFAAFEHGGEREDLAVALDRALDAAYAVDRPSPPGPVRVTDGLTTDEIEAVLDWSEGNKDAEHECDPACRVCSAREKLSAALEAAAQVEEEQ